MDATLLITRPIRSAQDFAAQAQGAGWRGRVVIAPLQQIDQMAPDPALLAQAGTLVFTSHHAVAALVGATDRRDWPVHVVGPRTERAARQAGFAQVQTAPGGDAVSLLDQLRRTRPPVPILHLRGRHVAMPLAARLNDAGLLAVQDVVYDQRALDLAPDAVACLRATGPVVVPLFSPRSARLFGQAVANQVGQVRADLTLIAISQAAADAVAQLPACKLHLSAQPDSHGVLDALLQVQRALEAPENPR